ncbi:MAG TPA: SRPBCC domain-containing protein [Vineibacter sp.]|nr:SRPBCC domain-containing protein [Vineibacter sp.]
MSPGKSASESEADRSLVIRREFDAPARLLFLAYSTSEHLMKWFGPKGWPLTLCEVDFRVGGRFRFAMTGPDGVQNTPFGGAYLEIVPNRKIVFDNAFEQPGSPKMIMTVTFDEKAGKTTLTLHTLFESVAMKNEYLGLGFEEGTGSAFDQLVDVVAALRAKESS